MARNALTAGADGSQLVVDTSGNATLDGGLTCTTITATGAQTLSGAITSTSTITTTDGVTSGDARTVGGVIDKAVAAGTAHTNSTDETVLDSYSIPANTLKAGTVVRIQGMVRATATNSTDTLTVKLLLGTTTLTGTALATSAAVDVANDDCFVVDYTLVARAAPGAAAAVVGHGFIMPPDAAGTAVVGAFMVPTNFATNGALLVELTGDWSVADAGNSCQSESLVVSVFG